MLINCKSCQKKFIVPDNAITKSGRLVQCGSCGDKWTQFPIDAVVSENKQIKKITVSNKRKKSNENMGAKRNLYTAEYLKKKHGLIINKSNDVINKKLTKDQSKKNSFGFYSYLLFLFIFFITLIGILEITKKTIILKYPLSEKYINYFYEIIEIIKIFITQIIN